MGVGWREAEAEREGGLCCILSKGLSRAYGKLLNWGSHEHCPGLERGGPAFIHCHRLLGWGFPQEGEAAFLSSVFPKGAAHQRLPSSLIRSLWAVTSFAPKGIYQLMVQSRGTSCPDQCSVLSLKNQCIDVWGAVWNFNPGLIKLFSLIIPL